MEIDRISPQICREAKETHEDKTDIGIKREKAEIEKSERRDQTFAEFDRVNGQNRGLMNRHSIIGLSAGLVAASIWGGMYVVSKVVLDVIPPFTLLTLRLVLGMLALGAVIALRKRTGFTRGQFRNSFLVGFVGYGISLGFQFVGTKLSTASNGSLVTSATPAFVLLFAPFLLGEKSTTRRIVALVISSFGVLAVIDHAQQSFPRPCFRATLV